MKTKIKYNFNNYLKSSLDVKGFFRLVFYNKKTIPCSVEQAQINFFSKPFYGKSPCFSEKATQKEVVLFPVMRSKKKLICLVSLGPERAHNHSNVFGYALQERKQPISGMQSKAHIWLCRAKSKPKHFICFAEQKKNEFNRNIEINYFKSIVFDRYTWLITLGRLYLIMRNLKYYIRELLETQKYDRLTLWILLPLIINAWQMNEIKKTSSYSGGPLDQTMMSYLKSNLPGLTEIFFSYENGGTALCGSSRPKNLPCRHQNDQPINRSLNQASILKEKNEFDIFSKKTAVGFDKPISIYTKSNPLSWETFALTDYQHKFLNLKNYINSTQITSFPVLPVLPLEGKGGKEGTQNLEDIENTSFYNTKFILKTSNLWGNKNFRLYSLIIPHDPSVGCEATTVWFQGSSNQKLISDPVSGPVYCLEFHETSLFNNTKFPIYWQTVDHIPKKLKSIYSDKIIALVMRSKQKNHMISGESKTQSMWIKDPTAYLSSSGYEITFPSSPFLSVFSYPLEREETEVGSNQIGFLPVGLGSKNQEATLLGQKTNHPITSESRIYSSEGTKDVYDLKNKKGMDNISNQDLKSTLEVGHLSDHPLTKKKFFKIYLNEGMRSKNKSNSNDLSSQTLCLNKQQSRSDIKTQNFNTTDNSLNKDYVNNKSALYGFESLRDQEAKQSWVVMHSKGETNKEIKKRKVSFLAINTFSDYNKLKEVPRMDFKSRFDMLSTFSEPSKRTNKNKVLTSYSLKKLTVKNTPNKRPSNLGFDMLDGYGFSIQERQLNQHKKKYFNNNKNFLVLQNKLIIFLSKTTNLDSNLSLLKVDKMLDNLWFNSSVKLNIGHQILSSQREENLNPSLSSQKDEKDDNKVFNIENNQTSVHLTKKNDLKNQENAGFLELLRSKTYQIFDLKPIPITLKNKILFFGFGENTSNERKKTEQPLSLSSLYEDKEEKATNIVYPRLMSGYFNPDKTFSNFNLGSQIFSIEIPPINFLSLPWKKKTERKLGDFSGGLGSSNAGNPTATEDHPFEELNRGLQFVMPNNLNRKNNINLTYIDTTLNNVFGVYDKVQADFSGFHQNMEGNQEIEQNNRKKKGWFHHMSFPFRKAQIEVEVKGIPQFTRNSKTKDIYLNSTNQNELQKSFQLQFSYSNPFKDSINEGLNRFGKTYSFSSSNLKNISNQDLKIIPSLTGKPSDSIKSTETLICLPQSRLPIPQLNLNLTEKMPSYTISKVQLDSLFYSYQIPFRSKLEWNNHFENWKTRLTNWISVYKGMSINDFDEESYCCEFEQLINELIFTRINKSVESVRPKQKSTVTFMVSEKPNFVHETNLRRQFVVLGSDKNLTQPFSSFFLMNEVNQSLSYLDYQHFFYSLIGLQIKDLKSIDEGISSLVMRSKQFCEPTTLHNQISQYLPYAEGHMMDHYSPQNQGGIRFGSLPTVYGVNKNDDAIGSSNLKNITHQMIYTSEPLTLFSIGAIFQFSFLFSNIVFLKYFYKLYGKELIQFILNATGWLKEADENSQQDIGLNELEKALLVVKKPQKRLKNIAGIKALLPEISLVIWFLRHAPKRIFWGIDYRLNVNFLKFEQNIQSLFMDQQGLKRPSVLFNDSNEKKKKKEQFVGRSKITTADQSLVLSSQKETKTIVDEIVHFISNLSFGRNIKRNWLPVFTLEEKEQILMKLRKTNQTPLSLGDIIPKGILLIGPPGTGKTFLVQALAGESEVPALVQSAGFLVSDPQLGLTRLEYLLDQARKLAPCIVFIDEIDTLGATRELVLNNPISENTIMDLLYNQLNSDGIGHVDKGFDYQQQEQQTKSKNFSGYFESNSSEDLNGQSELTNSVSSAIANQSIAESEARKNQLSLLTQFLIEMDGLKAHKQILFIGATNRAAVLDPALTRPGRFDKVLKIDLPGKQKRIEILKLYSRNIGCSFESGRTNNVSEFVRTRTHLSFLSEKDKKAYPSYEGKDGKEGEKKDWTYLANQTVGLSAADLAAIMNQSSIKAILNCGMVKGWSERPSLQLSEPKKELHNTSLSFNSSLNIQTSDLLPSPNLRFDRRKVVDPSSLGSDKNPLQEKNSRDMNNPYLQSEIVYGHGKEQHCSNLKGFSKTFGDITNIQDNDKLYGSKSPIHTLQTIEHGFNTIVNANKRQLIQFSSNKPPINFEGQKITSFKQLA